MGTGRIIEGARLFPPVALEGGPRAVLGARAGRQAGETAKAAAAAVERLKGRPGPPIETVEHWCAWGGLYLAAFDVCPACGWGPGFPYPDPKACADNLRHLIGVDDATAWFVAALRHLEWD